jgi:hypothetical protein
MRSLFTKVLFTALASIGLFSSPVFAATQMVNCDGGQSVGKALEAAKGSAERLEILISGTCTEAVTIRRNSVTLAGNPEATIEGTVTVFSSSAIWLENITLTGPGNGLVLSGNSDARLRWVRITDNEIHGLVMRRKASALVLNSTIEGNNGFGVILEDSTLQTNSSQINGNALYGIFADLGSLVVLVGTEVADNNAPGLQVMLHSAADLRAGVRFHGNQYHDLFAVEDSAIRISDPDVIVEGNIGCADSESSFSNPGEGTISTTDCSGFDQVSP